MSKIYRIYDKEGYPEYQTTIIEDAMIYARNKSCQFYRTVISVIYCDPAEDEEVQNNGIINEDQILVADFYEGRLMNLYGFVEE